jgi:hypothetical protein
VSVVACVPAPWTHEAARVGSAKVLVHCTPCDVSTFNWVDPSLFVVFIPTDLVQGYCIATGNGKLVAYELVESSLVPDSVILGRGMYASMHSLSSFTAGC